MGMFEFVCVCTSAYLLLDIREQDHMIDTEFADSERANAWRILESDSGGCNELMEWASRVYSSPGMGK